MGEAGFPLGGWLVGQEGRAQPQQGLSPSGQQGLHLRFRGILETFF